MEYELPAVVGQAFIVVTCLIVADTILAVILAIKNGELDFTKLPKFLASGILPYVGGLGVVALGAHFIGDPFLYIFYFAAGAAVLGYMKEILGKLTELFKAILTTR